MHASTRLGRTTRRALSSSCCTSCTVRCVGRRWPRRRQASVRPQEDDQRWRSASRDLSGPSLLEYKSLGTIDFTAVVQIFGRVGLWRRSAALSDPRDNSRTYRYCCAVVPDGYGLSYSIGDDYIRWTITSLKLETDIFKDCLAQAAMQTRQMMEYWASRVDGNIPRL